jgi:hypothetical protein
MISYLQEEHELQVSEQKVLGRIFNSFEKRSMQFMISHYKKLRDTYRSTGIVTVLVSRRLRWTRYGDKKCIHKFGEKTSSLAVYLNMKKEKEEYH